MPSATISFTTSNCSKNSNLKKKLPKLISEVFDWEVQPSEHKFGFTRSSEIQFFDMIPEFGLSQFIDEPTHKKEKSLDLVFSDRGKLSISVGEETFPHHFLFFFDVPVEVFPEYEKHKILKTFPLNFSF